MSKEIPYETTCIDCNKNIVVHKNVNNRPIRCFNCEIKDPKWSDTMSLDEMKEINKKD